MSQYDYYVINKEEELIEFEKGLYKTFSKISPDGWLMKNYQIIDNCRLRSYIPYDNLVIYKLLENNYVYGYVAVNVSYTDKTQFEKMGFKVADEDKDKRIADGLSMYEVENSKSKDSFKALLKFTDLFIEDLKRRNFDLLYIVCAENLRAMYTILGYDEIDSINLNNKKAFLFKLKIL